MTVVLRRGACPGLSAPMPTGDGLLARLTPLGTMPPATFVGFCAAARAHGNGIIEITARGSIQVRGLTPPSVNAFAQAVAALGIAASDGTAVIADPLAGLDPTEALDAGALAADLRAALAASAIAVGPKVSVAIDGGGRLHLDALHADVRLRAEAHAEGAHVAVAVGGTAATATPIGAVAPSSAIEAVLRLLKIIAAHGIAARADAVVRECGLETFTAAIREFRLAVPASLARPPAEPIGLHQLRAGKVALGVALPFGHADADTLALLADAARAAGAAGFRTAPPRALLIAEIDPARVATLAGVCERLGFITGAADPRRHVAACAGAPVCAAAEMRARTIAPTIAAAAAPLLDGSLTLHLSGCPKGCAHRGSAALTIVGHADSYGLVLDGATHDPPGAHVSAPMLPKRLARLAHAVETSHAPHERAADTLARLGAPRVAAILAEAGDA